MKIKIITETQWLVCKNMGSKGVGLPHDLVVDMNKYSESLYVALSISYPPDTSTHIVPQIRPESSNGKVYVVVDDDLIDNIQGPYDVISTLRELGNTIEKSYVPTLSPTLKPKASRIIQHIDDYIIKEKLNISMLPNF